MAEEKSKIHRGAHLEGTVVGDTGGGRGGVGCYEYKSKKKKSIKGVQKQPKKHDKLKK